MIPEIGHFALIIAFLIAAALTIFPIVGAQRGIPSWMAMARPAAQGLFVFVTLAMACLAYSFAVNDFSVLCGRQQLQLDAAAALSAGRRVGRP